MTTTVLLCMHCWANSVTATTPDGYHKKTSCAADAHCLKDLQHTHHGLITPHLLCLPFDWSGSCSCHFCQQKATSHVGPPHMPHQHSQTAALVSRPVSWRRRRCHGARWGCLAEAPPPAALQGTRRLHWLLALTADRLTASCYVAWTVALACKWHSLPLASLAWVPDTVDAAQICLLLVLHVEVRLVQMQSH